MAFWFSKNCKDGRILFASRVALVGGFLTGIAFKFPNDDTWETIQLHYIPRILEKLNNTSKKYKSHPSEVP